MNSSRNILPLSILAALALGTTTRAQQDLLQRVEKLEQKNAALEAELSALSEGELKKRIAALDV